MKYKLPLFLLAALIIVSAFAFSCAKETQAPPSAPTPAATAAAIPGAPAAPAQATPPPAKPASTAEPPAAGPPNQPATHAGRATCLACHEQGIAGAKKIPSDHAGRTDATCAACHKAPPT